MSEDDGWDERIPRPPKVDKAARLKRTLAVTFVLMLPVIGLGIFVLSTIVIQNRNTMPEICGQAQTGQVEVVADRTVDYINANYPVGSQASLLEDALRKQGFTFSNEELLESWNLASYIGDIQNCTIECQVAWLTDEAGVMADGFVEVHSYCTVVK